MAIEFWMHNNLIIKFPFSSHSFVVFDYYGNGMFKRIVPMRGKGDTFRGFWK